MSIRVHTTGPVLMKLNVHSQAFVFFFFVAQTSSFRQVDDGHPLVHAATLSAESVHFAQSRVFPQCGMWVLKRATN